MPGCHVRGDRPVRPGTFLNNHREVLAAMDFFTVPTLIFGILHVLLVIQHDSRKVLHVNLTAAWVSQQMRKAFPFAVTPRYLLMDRDAIFSAAVRQAIRHMGVCPVRTSFHSP